MTDFLDVRAVLDAAAEGWLEARKRDGSATVLVAEGSAFVRGLLRSELEMGGYRVLEAGTSEQACARFRTAWMPSSLPPIPPDRASLPLASGAAGQQTPGGSFVRSG